MFDIQRRTLPPVKLIIWNIAKLRHQSNDKRHRRRVFTKVMRESRFLFNLTACPRISPECGYHRLMADKTRDAQRDSHAMSAARTTGQKLSGWTGPVALLIALIAVALACWALVSAQSEAPAAAQQEGDPKARACSAFDTVSNAVRIQTHAISGPIRSHSRRWRATPGWRWSGAANIAEPPGPQAPPELADAIRSFANNLRDIGMSALGDVPATDPAQAARLSEGEASREQIAILCK